MLNISTIKEKLFGLVGFSNDPSQHKMLLAPQLLESRSGAYFQEAHPLVTLELLQAIAPLNLPLEQYPEVKSGSYKKGFIVRYGSELYRALEDTVYVNQFDETWLKVNVFSLWLEDKVKSAIGMVVQTVFANNIINNKGRDIILTSQLYTSNTYKNLLANHSNLVGFVLEPKFQSDKAIKLNKIGFYGEGIGSFPIYIFHSSNQNPVYTITFNKKLDRSFEWQTVQDIVLSEYDFLQKGDWIIAYDQDDLDALGIVAYNNGVDLASSGCHSCNKTYHLSRVINQIDFSSFEVSNTNFDGTLWDIEDNLYLNNRNYGLNFDLSIACNFDILFTQNEMDFVSLIQQQFAVNILKEYVYNPNARINRNAAIASRADVIYALDGDQSKFAKSSGLSYNLNRAYKVFELNKQGMSTICLPCVGSGVRYKTIGK